MTTAEKPDEGESPGDGEKGDSSNGSGEGDEGIVVEVEVDEEDSEEDLVANLEAQVKENYDRLVRTSADFDNFRKRSRREIADARVDEQSRVLRDVLPVADNIERAIAAATGDSAEVVSIRQGVDLVLRQLVGILERFNVSRVEAMGQPFDPNLHEAVSQIETDEHPPGTVVEVLQPGYRIGERLLRAALTIVAKAPAAAPSPGSRDSNDAEAEEPSDTESGDTSD